MQHAPATADRAAAPHAAALRGARGSPPRIRGGQPQASRSLDRQHREPSHFGAQRRAQQPSGSRHQGPRGLTQASSSSYGTPPASVKMTFQ